MKIQAPRPGGDAETARGTPRKPALLAAALLAALVTATPSAPARAEARVVDESDPAIRYFGSSPWHQNGVQAYALRGSSLQGWAYRATARTVSIASFINWNADYDSLDLHVWVDPPGFDGTPATLTAEPLKTFHAATLESAPSHQDEGYWARRLDILDFGSVQTHTIVVAVSNRKNGAVDPSPARVVEISLGAILLDAPSFSPLPADAVSGGAPGAPEGPAASNAEAAVTAVVAEELLLAVAPGRIDLGGLAPSRSPETRAAAVTVTVRANTPWTLRHAMTPLAAGQASAALAVEYRRGLGPWQPMPREPAPAAAGAPAAGETVSFDLRVHVPYTAPPGQYRGTLTYEVLPQ